MNSVAQRLHERELQVVGQAADVVVALDVGRPGAAAGLDDVGVERALDEELHLLAVRTGLLDHLARGVLEHADEQPPDGLALLLGVGHAVELGEEAVRRVDHLEADARGRDVVGLDLLALALAQQPVVDEDAGEVVADGLVHQGGRDRGVDAAGEPADHELVAHLGADRFDLVVDDARRRPGGLDAGDVVEEVLEHPLPVLAVHDLGVELHAGETPRDVLEPGDGRAVADRDDA